MVTINFKVEGRDSIMVFASDGTNFQAFNAHVEIQENRIAYDADSYIWIFQYLLWYIQHFRRIVHIDGSREVVFINRQKHPIWNAIVGTKTVPSINLSNKGIVYLIVTRNQSFFHNINLTHTMYELTYIKSPRASEK